MNTSIQKWFLAGAVLGGAIPLWPQAAPPVRFTSFPAETATARDIATGTDGNLWYTDSVSNQIRRMTPSGGVTAFSIPTPYTGFSITRGTDSVWFTGSQLFIEGSFKSRGRMAVNPAVADLGRITPAGALTTYETDENHDRAWDAALGSDGNIWFTYAFREAIGRILPDGTVSTFQLPTICCGNYPRAITAGPDGALWYTRFNSIGRITTAGDVTEFSYSSQAVEAAPAAITTGPDGALWLADGSNIVRVTPDGVTRNVFPVSSEATDIVRGPDNIALWFTLTGEGAGLGRITTTGTVNEYSNVPGSPYDPHITLGPDGALWLTRGTLIVRAQVSSLSSSLAAISFLYRVGGVLPASQTTSISSSGAAIAASASISPAATWVNVAPASGTTPFLVTATASPVGLTPSAVPYQTNLVVAGDAANSPLNIPVSITVQPPLAAAPSPLTFNYRIGGPVPGTQTVAITSGGVAVSIAAAAQGGAWLSVSPVSGLTPSNLTVGVAPLGLAIGSYAATVRVTAQDALGGVVDVPVTLNVLPSLTANPASLTFTYRTGAAQPNARTVVLTYSGSPVSVRAETVWSPPSGSLTVVPTTASAPASFSVSVNGSGLPIGSYSGTVNFIPQDGVQGTLSLPVTLNVVAQLAPASTPPSVTFISVGRSIPPEQTVSFSRPGGSGLNLRTDLPSTAAGLQLFGQVPEVAGEPRWTTQTYVDAGLSDVPVRLRIDPARIASLPYGTHNAVLTVTTDSYDTLQTTVPVVLEMRRPNIQVTGACAIPIVGESLNIPLLITGGSGTYSLALSAPPEFTVVPSGGAAGQEAFRASVSGIPAGVGPIAIQVTVTDTAESIAGTFRCDMYANTRYVPPVVLTTATCPASDVQLGTPVTRMLTASGGTGVFTFNSLDLPPGLRIVGNALSGTPTEAGNFAYTLTASSAGAQSAEMRCTFRVLPAPLRITSSCPTETNEGQRYYFPIVATGGLGGVSYNLTATGLPPGLGVTPGGIQGTATQRGTYDLQIQVRSGDQVVTQTCPLRVNDPAGRPPGPNATISCPTEPAVSGGGVSISVSASGGAGSYGFSASAPGWLALSQTGSGATLSGTAGPAGRYPLSVTVSDANGSTTVSCTLVVTEAPLVLTGPSCPATVAAGTQLDIPVSATGGTQPYAWSLTAGAGLSLSSASGSSSRVVGAPTEVGPLTISTSVTDASGNRRQSQCTIDVTPALLRITSQGCPTAPVNRPATLSVALAAAGGRGEYSWRFSGPSFLSISSSAGQSVSVTGSPAAPGEFSFTATLSDQANTPPATYTCSFTVPPVQPPGVQVNGLTISTNISQTNDLELVLSSPAPVPLTAAVALSFEPDVVLPGVSDNPLVQFTNGQGRAITVTIPAGANRVSLGSRINLSNMAGTARLAVSAITDAGQPILSSSLPGGELRLPRSAPVLDSVTFGSGGVVVRGFSNTLDMQSVTLTFTAAAGVEFDGPSTFNVTNEVQQFFRNLYQNRPPSGGSAFEVRFPVTIGGATDGIASVTVTFRNSAGETTGQATFR